MDANVFDVAKYILTVKGRMTTWKLQKLCYYSQAWHLAWDGVELFPEDFEAWENGPVCRPLYNEHKGKYSIDASELQKGNIEKLESADITCIAIVLNDYADMESYELSELTHQERPWMDARGDLPSNAHGSTVIPKSEMETYYRGLIA